MKSITSGLGPIPGNNKNIVEDKSEKEKSKFIDLPHEIFKFILGFSDFQDTYSLLQTCNTFYDFTKGNNYPLQEYNRELIIGNKEKLTRFFPDTVFERCVSNNNNIIEIIMIELMGRTFETEVKLECNGEKLNTKFNYLGGKINNILSHNIDDNIALIAAQRSILRDIDKIASVIQVATKDYEKNIAYKIFDTFNQAINGQNLDLNNILNNVEVKRFFIYSTMFFISLISVLINYITPIDILKLAIISLSIGTVLTVAEKANRGKEAFAPVEICNAIINGLLEADLTCIICENISSRIIYNNTNKKWEKIGRNIII